MKFVETIGKYTLLSVGIDEDSPMVNHKGGEIAVDDEHCIMYVYEIFIVTYGLESIRKSCLTYQHRQHNGIKYEKNI